jgi:hypothetical protein
MLIEHHPSHFN